MVSRGSSMRTLALRTGRGLRYPRYILSVSHAHSRYLSPRNLTISLSRRSKRLHFTSCAAHKKRRIRTYTIYYRRLVQRCSFLHSICFTRRLALAASLIHLSQCRRQRICPRSFLDAIPIFLAITN